MVEEANEYYKAGLHRLYDLFRDAEVFAELRQKYIRPDQRPTAQEIVRVSGAPSTDKAHEGGVDRIREHLATEDRPMLVRQGEWDRAPSIDQPPSPSTTASSPSIASPKLGSSADVDMPDDDSAPAQSNVADVSDTSADSRPPALSFPSPTYFPSTVMTQPAAALKHTPIPTAPPRPPLPQHAPYTHPGAPPRNRQSFHASGPIRGYPRLPLTTNGGLRHTPYPSPASLSPPSAHPTTFAQRPPAAPTAPAPKSRSFDTDITPSPPTVTVCPADLDLGAGPAPVQPLDLNFAGFESTPIVDPIGILGDESRGRDVPVVGLEDFEAAIAAVAAATNPGSNSGTWAWDARATAQWT